MVFIPLGLSDDDGCVVSSFTSLEIYVAIPNNNKIPIINNNKITLKLCCKNTINAMVYIRDNIKYKYLIGKSVPNIKYIPRNIQVIAHNHTKYNGLYG